MMSITKIETKANMAYLVFDEGCQKPHFTFIGDSLGNFMGINHHTNDKVEIEVELRYSNRKGSFDIVPYYEVVFDDCDIIHRGHRCADAWWYLTNPMRTALTAVRKKYGFYALRL